MTILNGGSRKFYLSTVAMWMAIMFFVALFAFGLERTTTIQKHDPPKAKNYTCLISVDEFVRVCYNADTTSVPPVERYAKAYKFIDDFFVGVSREETPVHIYIHSYKKFVKRLTALDMQQGAEVVEGRSVYRAFTYRSKKESAAVIEAYQPLTDNTFIHEVIHHYLDRVVLDGSLNFHGLIWPYTIHIEAQFREVLEESY